jgi:hypothetical protein
MSCGECYGRTQVNSSFNSDIRNEFANYKPPTLKSPECPQMGYINYSLPGFVASYPLAAPNQFSSCPQQPVQMGNPCPPQQAVQMGNGCPPQQAVQMGNAFPQTVQQVAATQFAQVAANQAVGGPFYPATAVNVGSANVPPVYSVSQGGCQFNTNPDAKFRFSHFKTPYFDENSCTAISNYSKGTPGNYLNTKEALNGQGLETINEHTLPSLSHAYASLPPVPLNMLLFSAVPLHTVGNLSEEVRSDPNVDYAILANYVHQRTLVVNAHTSYYVQFVAQLNNILYTHFIDNPSANEKYRIWFATGPCCKKPISGMCYMRVGSFSRVTFESYLTNRVIFMNFGYFDDDDDGDSCTTRCPIVTGCQATPIYVEEHPISSGHSRS